MKKMFSKKNLAKKVQLVKSPTYSFNLFCIKV